MELTKERIQEIDNALSLVLGLGFDNIRTGYWIGRLKKKTEPIAAEINEANNKLIIEVYGTKEGEKYFVSKDKMEAYKADLKVITDITVTIEIPEFKLEEFNKCYKVDSTGIKKESVMPNSFFALMGDLVKE